MAGEMARLHNISKQTLLYYDKIGLLRPIEKDSATGYRYYHLQQCEDLDIILMLKELGMSLKEIRAFRNQPSAWARVGLLESQAHLIQKKIKGLKRVRSSLHTMVENLKTSLSVLPFDTGIRWIDPRPIIYEMVPPPHDEYALELAFKKIYRSTRHVLNLDIHEFLFFTEEQDGKGVLFRKVALPCDQGYSDIISGGYYAYIYHKGDFEALEKSRSTLAAYIQKTGHTVTGPAMERVLLSRLAVPSESEYLIEIQVPVEQAGASK